MPGRGALILCGRRTRSTAEQRWRVRSDEVVMGAKREP